MHPVFSEGSGAGGGRSNSIAPRTASPSLGTASAPSFWCFRPARSYAPGHTCGNRIPATRGQVCWSCPLPVAPQLCRGADPSLNNQTCSLCATPACWIFASLELRILLATLREQPAHVSVPPHYLFFVLPTSSELCPRAYILESSPRDKRPGLLALPAASCSATLRRSRPKHQQGSYAFLTSSADTGIPHQRQR